MSQIDLVLLYRGESVSSSLYVDFGSLPPDGKVHTNFKLKALNLSFVDEYTYLSKDECNGRGMDLTSEELGDGNLTVRMTLTF